MKISQIDSISEHVFIIQLYTKKVKLGRQFWLVLFSTWMLSSHVTYVSLFDEQRDNHNKIFNFRIAILIYLIEIET